MKQVLIYSRGSRNYNNEMGYFSCALEYNGKYKYITGEVKNSSPAQCILIGLAEAINLIKSPCKLVFVVADKFSFNKAGNPKGRNKEIKQLIIDISLEKECDFEFNFRLGGGQEIKEKLEQIRKVGPQISPVGIDEILRGHLNKGLF